MMIWMGILLAALVVEFITIELYGVCVAVGAIAGLVLYVLELPIYVQAGVSIGVAVVLVAAVRPIGMKYVNRMRKERRMQDMIGADAIVVRTINNAQGVGMVSIDGKSWSARSHRPNAVIEAGQVVTVIRMNNNTAIVDDNRRNRE